MEWGDPHRHRAAHVPGDSRRRLEAAHRAFAAGVDGVFCYDHLWPLGQPDRPALAPFPILATLAASLRRSADPGGGPFFGTLVAGSGWCPTPCCSGQFMRPGPPGAGPGHRRSGHRGPAERGGEPGLRHTVCPGGRAAADMVEWRVPCGSGASPCGWPVGRRARIDEAQAAGAALNVWDADPELVASRSQGPDAVEVTWGGPPSPGQASPRPPTVTALARGRRHAGRSSAGPSTPPRWRRPRRAADGGIVRGNREAGS